MQFRQLSVVEVTSSPGFQYDVFIAHSSQDAQVVRQLRDHLSDIGFTTWAYDDVLPGEPVHLSICAAMCRSRRCLLLVTPSYINSIFFQDELNNALDRQCRLGLVFCLPVYHQLDPDSRPYQLRDMHGLDYHSEDFWQKLKSAVKNDVLITSRLEVTHTGVGLAWSYFYGYLNIVLPELPDRIRQSSFPECYQKMLIIIPESCFCPADVSQADPNFQFAGHVGHQHTRCGNVKRDYKSSVYHFKFVNSEEVETTIDIVLEFATPLLSLYEMHASVLANLSEPAMKTERDKFKEVLMKILCYKDVCDICQDKYLIVNYRDVDQCRSTSSGGSVGVESLSDAVRRELERDLMVEYQLGARP